MAKENNVKREVKTVSLVLGSGGARGLAHIGVIKWLEENNFKIKSIAGCQQLRVKGSNYKLLSTGHRKSTHLYFDRW